MLQLVGDIQFGLIQLKFIGHFVGDLACDSVAEHQFIFISRIIFMRSAFSLTEKLFFSVIGQFLEANDGEGV